MINIYPVKTASESVGTEYQLSKAVSERMWSCC